MHNDSNPQPVQPWHAPKLKRIDVRNARMSGALGSGEGTSGKS